MPHGRAHAAYVTGGHPTRRNASRATSCACGESWNPASLAVQMAWPRMEPRSWFHARPWMHSEVVLRAELQPARITGNAACCSVRRVGRIRLVAVAAEVLEVEDVEHIDRDPDPIVADGQEILPQAQVEVPVRPEVREDERVPLRLSAAGFED